MRSDSISEIQARSRFAEWWPVLAGAATWPPGAAASEGASGAPAFLDYDPVTPDWPPGGAGEAAEGDKG